MTYKELIEALLDGKEIIAKNKDSEHYKKRLDDKGNLIYSVTGRSARIQNCSMYKIVEPEKFRVLYYNTEFEEYDLTDSKYENYDHYFETYREHSEIEFVRMLPNRED